MTYVCKRRCYLVCKKQGEQNNTSHATVTIRILDLNGPKETFRYVAWQIFTMFEGQKFKFTISCVCRPPENEFTMKRITLWTQTLLSSLKCKYVLLLNSFLSMVTVQYANLYHLCLWYRTNEAHSVFRSFHVVEKTRTSVNRAKMKHARAKRAIRLFFTQFVKYVNCDVLVAFVVVLA